MKRRRKQLRSTSILIPSSACCPGHYLENLKIEDQKKQQQLRASRSISVAAFGELDEDFKFLKDYPSERKLSSKDDSVLITQYPQEKRSFSQGLKSLLGVSFRLDKNYLKFNSAFGHYGRYTITPGTEPSVRDRLSLGSRNNNDPPAMRIKARFQAVDILPLSNYNKLSDFIKELYLPLCLHLEPILNVKAKEDLATSLVRILHKQQLAESFLCNLIMSEVDVLGL
uniref:Uncharacterized protein n=1 Tax=Panagrolaimus superbus TaxID=310955 RepID=A0A914YP66_9BILA